MASADSAPPTVELIVPRILQGRFKVLQENGKRMPVHDKFSVSFAPNTESPSADGVKMFDLSAVSQMPKMSYTMRGTLAWNEAEQKGQMNVLKYIEGFPAPVVMKGELQRAKLEDAVLTGTVPIVWSGRWGMTEESFDSGTTSEFSYTDKKKAKKKAMSPIAATVSQAKSMGTPRAQRTRTQPKKHQDIDDSHLSRKMKACLDVLSYMMRHENGFYLKDPVDPSLTEYHEKVAEPICLNDIRERIMNEVYDENHELFARDMRLVWHNCMSFNPSGSIWHEGALKASKAFEQKFQRSVMKGEIEKDKLALQNKIAQYKQMVDKEEEKETKRVAKEQKKLDTEYRKKLKQAQQKKNARKRKLAGAKAARAKKKVKRKRTPASTGGGGTKSYGGGDRRDQDMRMMMKRVQELEAQLRAGHSSGVSRGGATGVVRRAKKAKKTGPRPLSTDDRLKLVEDINSLEDYPEVNERITDMIQTQIPSIGAEDDNEVTVDLDLLNERHPKLLRNIKDYVHRFKKRVEKKKKKMMMNMGGGQSADTGFSRQSEPRAPHAAAPLPRPVAAAPAPPQRTFAPVEDDFSRSAGMVHPVRPTAHRPMQAPAAPMMAQPLSQPTQSTFSDDDDDDDDEVAVGLGGASTAAGITIDGWESARSETTSMHEKRKQMQLDEQRLAQAHRNNQALSDARLLQSSAAMDEATKREEQKRRQEEEQKRHEMEQQRAREAAEREQGQAPLFQSNDHDNDFGSMGEFHLGL